jgi:hypothetical protein
MNVTELSKLLEAYNNDSWKLEPTEYDFNKSLSFRYSRKDEMSLFFTHSYFLSIRGQTVKRKVPVMLSNGAHVKLRGQERGQITDQEFEKCLKNALQAILRMNKLEPNGYLVTSSSLSITIPLFVFKNTDPGSDIARFVEVKTILTKGSLGTDSFTVSSNPDARVRKVIDKAIPLVVESKQQFIQIDVE